MNVDFVISSVVFFLFIVVVFLFVSSRLLTRLTSAEECRRIVYKVRDEFLKNNSKLSLLSEIYRIPIVVTDKFGYDRVDDPVSMNLTFDQNCDGIAFNSSVRVFDASGNEFPSFLSYETYCRGGFLKTAILTTFVNVTKNSNSTYFVLFHNETVPRMNYTTPLMLWLKFDEASGTLAHDFSGFENTGTLYNGSTQCFGNGCPSWIDGKYGNAIQLDGLNDFVKIENSESLDISNMENGFTVEAWVKINSPPASAEYTIVGKEKNLTKYGGLEWSLEFYTSGGIISNLKFCVSNSSSTSVCTETSTSTGTWRFVAGVFNTTHVLLYDFPEDATTTVEPSISTYTGSLNDVNSWLTVGGFLLENGTVQSNFDGLIDDVRVFNRSLSSEEILWHKNQLRVSKFSTEKLSIVTPSKLDELRSQSYEIVKSFIGNEYEFSIQIEKAGE